MCYSPPLLAGFRCCRWCAAPRHSWLGLAGCGGVFRGRGCPLLCVFVVCVGVRGGRAVLCVACLWCLCFWLCGVVVRWLCLLGALLLGLRVCVCAFVALRVGVSGVGGGSCAVWLPCVCVCVLAVCGWWGGVCHTLGGSRRWSSAWFKKQKKTSCRRVAQMRGMRDACYVPLLLSHRVFFPCRERERACAGLFGGLVGCFCVLCFVSPPFFSFSVASSITHLLALRFPYEEGVEGAFVLFFFVTYLSYPVQLLVAVPYRESVCLFVGGAGVGFHTMFLLCLVPVFLHLTALCTFVFSCAVRHFGAFRRIFNILVRHTIVSPWYVAILYSESVCVAGGAGWGFIPCFSLLLSPSSCTLRSCSYVCVCAWSVPLAPSFAFLTYLLAIPLFPRGSWASPIARARCVGGVGVGFHTSFLFDLVSVFFHSAGLRTFGCVRAWCAPLAPSFVFLPYLFAFSLFPHCPWPPHTFCAFVDCFFFVSRGGRSLLRKKYGGYMVVVCVCGYAF